MRKIRIHNDIFFRIKITRGTRALDLTGYKVQLLLRCASDDIVISSHTINAVDTGVIEFSFLSKEQNYLGSYTLVVRLTDSQGQSNTIDYLALFELVPHSCMSNTGEEDEEVVTLTLGMDVETNITHDKEYYEDLFKYLEESFLRKDVKDAAKALITFLEGVDVGTYVSGKTGASITPEGAAELQSLVTRAEAVVKQALTVQGTTYAKGQALFYKEVLAYGLAKFFSDVEINSDIYSKNFVSGLFGSGWKMQGKNAMGRSCLELDELYVRVKAYFDTLEIRHVTHVAGVQIISPGGMVVKSVEAIANDTATDGESEPKAYKLSFKADDGDEAVYNSFAVGDLAYCKTFNIKPGIYHGVSNQYYWRLVTEIGEDYIVVSNRSGETDLSSTAPKAGDNVAVLGNVSDKGRQGALILASVGEGAPYFAEYVGINSFTLEGKEATRISPISENRFTGDFVLKNTNTSIEYELDNIKQGVTDATRSVIDLDHESVQLITDETGTVIEGLSSNLARVYEGAKVSTAWDFAATWEHCTGTIDSLTGAISITNVSQNSNFAYVHITATKSTESLRTTLTIHNVTPARELYFDITGSQFYREGQGHVLTAKPVMKMGNRDITASYHPTQFVWTRTSEGTATDDENWNSMHTDVHDTLEVTTNDLVGKTTFTLTVYDINGQEETTETISI